MHPSKKKGAYPVVQKSAKTFRSGSELGRFLILVANAGHVAYGGHVGNAGHVDDGVAEGGDARDGQFAGFLQHVEAHDNKGERGKADGEDGEGGQEFANDVELRQRYDGQESP